MEGLMLFSRRFEQKQSDNACFVHKYAQVIYKCALDCVDGTASDPRLHVCVEKMHPEFLKQSRFMLFHRASLCFTQAWLATSLRLFSKPGSDHVLQLHRRRCLRRRWCCHRRFCIGPKFSRCCEWSLSCPKTTNPSASRKAVKGAKIHQSTKKCKEQLL